jgi:hypothetical protein
MIDFYVGHKENHFHNYKQGEDYRLEVVNLLYKYVLAICLCWA